MNGVAVIARIPAAMTTWFQGTINEFIEPNKKATNAASEPFASSAACRSRSKASARYRKSRQRDHLLKKGSPLALCGLRCYRQSRRHHVQDFPLKALIWMVATWLLFVANSQIVSAQDRAAISLDPIAWTPIGPAPSVNGRTTFLEDTSGRITTIVAHPTDPNVLGGARLRPTGSPAADQAPPRSPVTSRRSPSPAGRDHDRSNCVRQRASLVFCPIRVGMRRPMTA
jgi:hypothetical protein